ncbi:MAG: hypothetical protein HY885_12905 [Deltaproteobacteria bacterium]|nr:hypothetical protein [Deltaproteobacteria bacterium]
MTDTKIKLALFSEFFDHSFRLLFFLPHRAKSVTPFLIRARQGKKKSAAAMTSDPAKTAGEGLEPEIDTCFARRGINLPYFFKRISRLTEIRSAMPGGKIISRY